VSQRIAVWSGPRNISTALLRSFGNRPDTFVTDEPLYAPYLLATGRVHPGADEVVAAHESDWRKVVSWLTGPVPGGRAVWYQKHMAHHLLPDMDREWIHGLHNAFLIRDPRAMLISLAKNIPDATLADTGLPQQVELFEEIRRRTGRVPPVLDARDVLADPRGQLEPLCRALGLGFTDAMLSWPPGRRDTDGVWARYWYEAVERSTGFLPFRERDEVLAPNLEPLLAECRPFYEALHAHRLGQTALG
jgi:hypothetical protein